MNSTATGQIVSIPARIWYVHVNGKFDSMWLRRRLARDEKNRLSNYGVKNIKIGSSTIAVGAFTEDLHS